MMSIFNAEVKTMFKESKDNRSSDQTTLGNIHIYRVLKPEELLVDQRRKDWLEELPELTGASAVNYRLYYLPALLNFAALVQNLPETKEGFYSHEGAFIDHGFERTKRAMQLFQNYLQMDIEPEKSKEQKALWNYAVYTAALLFDVGKVVTKLIVTLRQRTKKMQIWNPFEGDMLKFATHYSYEFGVENWDELRRQVTPVIAQRLMPELGFAWLSSDKAILSAWFALLRENYSQVGVWLSSIPLADAELFEGYFSKYEKELAEKAKNDKLALFKDASLMDEVTKASLAKTGGLFSGGFEKGAHVADKRLTSAVAGEAFLQWLRKNVESGKVSVNLPNSGVHVVSEGVLLLEKVFQDFVKENPLYHDWRTVKQQFEQLEISRQMTNQQQEFRQYADNEFKSFTGAMVLANMYAVFLRHHNMPGVNPNIVSVNLAQEVLPKPQVGNVNMPVNSPQNLPK